MRASCIVFTILAVLAGCNDNECPAGEIRVGSLCRAVDRADEPDAEPVSGSTRADAAAQRNDDDADVIDGTDASSGPEDGGQPSADAANDDDTRDARTTPNLCGVDQDGDGYAGMLPSGPCLVDGFVPLPGDCDDAKKEVHPGTKDLCSDGIDNDCDGRIDNGEPEQCNGLDDDCDPVTADGAGACGTFACKDAKCVTTCTLNADCAKGLFCADGACKADNDGASCSDAAQCASGWCCASVDWCDEPNKCLLSPGKLCTDNLDCGSGTCVKTCLFHESHTNEICDDNADCSSSPFTQICVGGRCKRFVGEPCTADDECNSGRCVAGKQCAYPNGSPLQAACEVDSDCATSLRCELASNRCKAPLNVSCRYTDDCLLPYVCKNARCSP